MPSKSRGGPVGGGAGLFYPPPSDDDPFFDPPVSPGRIGRPNPSPAKPPPAASEEIIAAFKRREKAPCIADDTPEFEM